MNVDAVLDCKLHRKPPIHAYEDQNDQVRHLQEIWQANDCFSQEDNWEC